MESQRGLTLVEMLVTLGIMALVATVAMPLLHRPPGAIDLDSVVRAVAASLREARSAAVASHRDVIFTLDVERKVFGHDHLQAIGQVGQTAVGNLRIIALTADSQQGGRGAAVIRFFPNGGSTGGQIEFRAGALRSRVDVDWLTGRVSVTRGNDAG